jgi:D-alanyl-D-alanine carboxypeptidase
MNSTAEAVQPAVYLAGHNRISTQALTTLAQAAAAEALGVSAQDVRADWSDDDGLLALRDPLRVAGYGGTVWDRAVAAKTAILERVTQLSGSTLSRVDIRISGARVSEGPRVR